MRGRGLHPSPPAKIAHRLGAHLLRLDPSPPKGNAQLVTPASHLNQGNTGTCHAHSFVAALWTALRAALGHDPAYLGSPCMVASCTYADVQRAGWQPGQPLLPLVDTGADLQDDATAGAKWGVAPIRSLPTDVPPDQPGVPFPEPDRSQLVQGSADLIGGEYSIPVQAGCAVTVAQCLDANIPVWIGFFCDTEFENGDASVVRGAPNAADPNGGGHAVYLSGYRTNPAGDLEFRLENSWGDEWCDAGGCWVSVAFVEACWSLWPFAVTVPS